VTAVRWWSERHIRFEARGVAYAAVRDERRALLDRLHELDEHEDDVYQAELSARRNHALMMRELDREDAA
jgi:hypothetical protein